MVIATVTNLEPMYQKESPDKIRAIVDSYDSMTAISGKDKARQLIKEYFKIDDSTLNNYLNDLTLKNGGRIISVDEQKRERKDLDNLVLAPNSRSSISASTPNAIYDSKVAEEHNKQETYSHGKTGNVTKFPERQDNRNSSNVKQSYDLRTAAKRAVAWVAAGAALFVTLHNPFARINHSYAEGYDRQMVENSNHATNKSLDEELGGLGFRVAHNVTSEPYQVSAATSPASSPDPSSAKSATKSITLIGVLKEQGVKGDYSHETDEIIQFREGKIKYGDASEGTKMWFGIPKKRPKLNFEHKDDEFRMYVEMGVNKKLHDLDGLLAGVKVGGKWYFSIDPKKRDYVGLNNQEYGALKGKRATQVILYRNIRDAEGNDVRLIGGSWNYGKIPTKPPEVAKVEKPKEEVRVEPPKVEKPKESPRATKQYRGGTSAILEHLTPYVREDKRETPTISWGDQEFNRP